jgi:hypothetical protein
MQLKKLLRRQGDQIEHFCELGFFWMSMVTFWKDEVAQRNGNIWATFFSSIFSFLHFHLNKQFQSRISRGIFRFQKWWRCFGLSNWALMERYFGIYGLGSCFGSSFSKIWAFFQYTGHPVRRLHPKCGNRNFYNFTAKFHNLSCQILCPFQALRHSV